MNCCYTVVYWTYKTLFCCSRALKKIIKNDDEVRYSSIPSSKTPWLWIGAEMNNGSIVTVTDKVNKHIQYDDVITPEYLGSVTNIPNGVSRWLYLDSKTLNEQEFPPEGLVIKNDSIESESS